jgi:hypothetical protein
MLLDFGDQMSRAMSNVARGRLYGFALHGLIAFLNVVTLFLLSAGFAAPRIDPHSKGLNSIDGFSGAKYFFKDQDHRTRVEVECIYFWPRFVAARDCHDICYKLGPDLADWEFRTKGLT